jgi:hypothetical protein
MESTQGLSLHSYLYLKIAKPPSFSYFLKFLFFLLQNQRTKGYNRFCLEEGVGTGMIVGKGVGG